MQCPHCHQEIKAIENCPVCNSEMIFMSGQGPMGTWECRICSDGKTIIGYRTTPMGLMRVEDEIGRYKKPE